MAPEFFQPNLDFLRDITRAMRVVGTFGETAVY